VEVSIDFPKEQLTKVNSVTLGQFVCYGEIILGWCKGRQNKKCSNQRFRKAVCSLSVIGPLVFRCWFRYAP
jgi:hypothetical protein